MVFLSFFGAKKGRFPTQKAHPTDLLGLGTHHQGLAQGRPVVFCTPKKGSELLLLGFFLRDFLVIS